jgi:hypothetical protein
MQNLERRPSAIYVARLPVPSRLRAVTSARYSVATEGMQPSLPVTIGLRTVKANLPGPQQPRRVV